jgi:hypothetical protein
MPAYQSLPEFDLSEKYHLKAACCEKCAEYASDQTIAQEWQKLATQWHSMPDQAAAQMSEKASQDEFEQEPNGFHLFHENDQY